MGKPLSRPDCLRKNPSCMGKGEEEDLNIDDCYVPQRSIYDTVRLNEQIDSSSKGSLASRHLTGTLPYTNRTLEFAGLCENGVLSASSSFELRSRKAAMLDERAVFDGLKLNGNIIRATDAVLPKPRFQGGEKKDFPQYRRSWRTFAPTNLGDYISRSGTLCSSTDRPALIKGRRGQSMTSSLTSEEDSGLYSPTVERDRHTHHANRRVGPGTRSLSSSEAMHMSGDLKTGRSLSSGQEDFPYSPARDSVSLYHSHSLVQEGRHSKFGLRGKDFRSSSGSGSKLQSLGWRSKRDYEEQSTAELLEDVPSAEDCELVSIAASQPETYGNSVTLPIESRQRTKPCNSQLGASRYSLEELEEFLQSVEACLPKCLEELQQAGEHEIEFFLNAIAACSDIETTSTPSLQVPEITTFTLGFNWAFGWFTHCLFFLFY